VKDLGKLKMTEDRLMVAEAVFNGLIGEEHLTQAEIDEMFELVAHAAMEQEMARAAARGCSVFEDWEDDPVH
jgi:hypothetical protein